MNPTQQTPFTSMELSETTLRALERIGFETATEIQAKAIPLLLSGREVIAKAPTGTGKTCAFGLPIIEGIPDDEKRVVALILAPTRELAQQICKELQEFAFYRPDIRITALFGGQKIERQLTYLAKKPQIVVATPGRLIDHLNRRSIRLDSVKTLVLDECDEMLNMGFYKDVKKIIERTPKNRILSMFSATISREVMDISWVYQQNAEELTVNRDLENDSKITYFSIESSDKTTDTIKLIKAEKLSKCIIFCNTKHMCDRLYDRMLKAGVPVEAIHGDLKQSQRTATMNAYKQGKFDILIATDVAARGIDVDNIDAVINYDIPDDNSFFLHRTGRCGRAGKDGVAYTFFGRDEGSRLRELGRLTKVEIAELAFDAFNRLGAAPKKPEVDMTKAPSPPRLRRNR